MRQAGIIAAAGKLALTEMVDRMKEDHRNVKTFAQGWWASKRLPVSSIVIYGYCN